MTSGLTIATVKPHLFRSFDDIMLSRRGMGCIGAYSAHDIGFIIAGHQRWHFNIIEERYIPLSQAQAGALYKD